MPLRSKAVTLEQKADEDLDYRYKYTDEMKALTFAIHLEKTVPSFSSLLPAILSFSQ